MLGIPGAKSARDGPALSCALQAEVLSPTAVKLPV